MSVQSVERAVALMVASASGDRTLTELAAEVALPVSTAARLLSTLCALDVVARDQDGTYRPGPTLQGLAIGMDRTANFRALFDPTLVDLVAATNETCGLSVAVAHEVRYLSEVSGSNLIQVREFTNYQLPLHIVSSGLAIMAHWPTALIDRYLALDLEDFTAASITDPIAIRDRLERIRYDGYCWTREEFAEGISSVAAPVLDSTGAPVAALHCHGPSFRFDPSRESEIQAAVAGAAEASSTALGAKGEAA